MNKQKHETFTPAAPDIFTKIRNYYNSKPEEEHELTKQEERILKRWKSAYEWLQVEKKLHVANRLQRTYGVSDRTAYSDIISAKQLFNPINRNDKDFKRIVLVNWIEEDIRAARKIQSVEKRIRLAEKLYAQLYRAIGLDKDDIAAITPDMLGNNTLIAKFQLGDKEIEIDLDNTSYVPKHVKRKLLQASQKEINIEEAEILLENKKD